MPRHKWQPDEQQAEVLDRVAELRDAAAEADAAFLQALAEARTDGIPPTALAERLGMERKSVYRLLGHKDK